MIVDKIRFIKNTKVSKKKNNYNQFATKLD